MKYTRLLNQLAIDNIDGSLLNISNVTFSDPVICNILNYNTYITITPIANSGIIGDSVIIYYNRLNIIDIGDRPWVFSNNSITPTFILDIINSLYLCDVLPEDVSIPQIPIMRIGDIILVKLTISDISVDWIGSIDINGCMGLDIVCNKLEELMNATIPVLLG